MQEAELARLEEERPLSAGARLLKLLPDRHARTAAVLVLFALLMGWSISERSIFGALGALLLLAGLVPLNKRRR